MIDLIEHRIALAAPRRLTQHSFWHEHIPFGMFLVSAAKPRTLVELGTHYGDSYCAFCQAVQTLELDTLCYAVDNWQGDLHYGHYGCEVLDDLRAHHDPRYQRFSVLLQKDFATACAHFRDGSIDLLHIDGTHTYEAVKADFEMWLPKMSARGIVLLHDTNVLRENFGVRQFFDEVKARYPHFEFLHGYGLGVLGVGADCPEVVKQLSRLDAEETALVRNIFETLGGGLDQRVQREKELFEQIAAERRKQDEILAQKAEVENAAQDLVRMLQATNKNLEEITGSRGWHLLQKMWRTKRALTSVLGAPAAPVTANGEPPAASNGNAAAGTLPAEPEAVASAPPPIEEPEEISTLSSRIPSGLVETLTRQARERLAQLPTETVRPIALYLSQFHQIPENDEWWGKGFTEWTNTRKAQPLFAGHYQPQIPGELGYYDLSDPAVLERQAALAREYGIHGFCFYYYWFNGKRLLEKPIETMLASRHPDFPYCFMWANESWSRRWDGLGENILMAQEHSYEDDLNFIRNLIPAFQDSRYIKINGRPLLIIYRIGKFTPQSIEIWRDECRKAGLGEIYIAATLAPLPVEDSLGARDPRLFGCDAAMEFPPHGVNAPVINERIKEPVPDFQGKVLDYLEAAAHYISRPPAEYPVFRGVMTAWDNTARRRNAAHVFYPHSPELYGYWLTSIVEQTIQRHANPEERLIFINAWNEWAEGAHLEPDEQFGRRFLEETRKSLGRA